MLLINCRLITTAKMQLLNSRLFTLLLIIRAEMLLIKFKAADPRPVFSIKVSERLRPQGAANSLDISSQSREKEEVERGFMACRALELHAVTHWSLEQH
jgi:hypothetical protein